MEIVIENLTKVYGSIHALSNISLHIGQGTFGLLGPNGAGKSTLIKIMTTLSLPTSGEIYSDGINLRRRPEYIRQRLGYVPQVFGFYPRLNAYELLDYIGAMKNVPKPMRKRQAHELLDEVNLTQDAKRPVGTYSGGMRQRLGIAQALMGDPELLVVDEPTAGLDPEERIRFRNLLTRLAGNRAIVLSTHIVADIEMSCIQVAVLNKGQLVFNGKPDELLRYAEGRIWQIEITPQEWNSIEAHHKIISSRPINDGKLLLRVLANAHPLERGWSVSPVLEDAYIAAIS